MLELQFKASALLQSSKEGLKKHPHARKFLLCLAQPALLDQSKQQDMLDEGLYLVIQDYLIRPGEFSAEAHGLLEIMCQSAFELHEILDKKSGRKKFTSVKTGPP